MSKKWSRERDSNPRPALYESAAACPAAPLTGPSSPILYLKIASVIPLHPSSGAPLPTIWSANGRQPAPEEVAPALDAWSGRWVAKRVAGRTGIERFHWHLLRHTFAMNYLVNGGDAFSLQRILGHTTLEMVRRYMYLADVHIRLQHRRYSPMDVMQAAIHQRPPAR